MNGKQGIESIGKLFADNYKELYNSVSYNCSEMNSSKTYINDKIISDCDTNVCNVSHNIDVTDVQNAVQFLKHNKSDGTNELYSDAIINGGDVLYNHLSMLFSACITHGITPNNMLSGTLIPIPKNAKKACRTALTTELLHLVTYFVNFYILLLCQRILMYFRHRHFSSVSRNNILLLNVHLLWKRLLNFTMLINLLYLLLLWTHQKHLIEWNTVSYLTYY